MTGILKLFVNPLNLLSSMYRKTKYNLIHKKTTLLHIFWFFVCKPILYTGCSLNIVFFSKILKYIPDSGLYRVPLGVSVCTQWQVKHQRCCRTCRVEKNNNILRKNTIFNEHPVYVRCFQYILPIKLLDV